MRRATHSGREGDRPDTRDAKADLPIRARGSDD
jgi:hypothetical protein